MKTTTKNKVTNVKVLGKPCETSNGFKFTLKINGIDAGGFFAPVGSCISNADCNELKVGSKNIKIANSSGYRFYELSLHSSDFTKNPKQKNFRFTGAYFLLPELQNKIKEKVLSIISNPKVELTEEFKTVFKIKM